MNCRYVDTDFFEYSTFHYRHATAAAARSIPLNLIETARLSVADCLIRPFDAVLKFFKLRAYLVTQVSEPIACSHLFLINC